MSFDASPSSSGIANLEDRNAGESVLGKTQAVIDALATKGALTLAAVSKESGVPKTTTFRILRHLREWGLVERDPRGFVLGRELVSLALRVPLGELAIVGRPYAADFFASTRVTSSLFVQDAPGSVRCVEKIYGPNEPGDRGGVPGVVAPEHCTAAGKVMMAFDPGWPERPEGRPFVRYTPRTIQDQRRLSVELAQARRNGYAIDGEEWEQGICAVAVPILGRQNRVLGALSCGGQSRVDEWTPQTLVQVRSIAFAMKRQAVRIAKAMEPPIV